MRTRSHWLVGGLSAALIAIVLVGSAAASQFFLDLDSSDTEWPLGGEANLQVSVDPALVGGCGVLQRACNGDVVNLGTFCLTSTCFTITADLPKDEKYIGKLCKFRYIAYTAGGVAVDVSPVARKPIAPLEIE